jgi:transposase-like protein
MTPWDAQMTAGAEDVAAKPRRRTYTMEYKGRILKEADACRTTGAVGAWLRREGLCSSHLVVWRRARRRGELASLAQKREIAKEPQDGRRKPDARTRREGLRLVKVALASYNVQVIASSAK